MSIYSRFLSPVCLSVALFMWPNMSAAVTLDPDSLPSCYGKVEKPYVPIPQRAATVKYNIRACEGEDFISLKIWSLNPIEPGQSFLAEWETKFWEGSLAITQDLSGAGFREVNVTGDIAHTHPTQAPAFEFEVTGGGNGKPPPPLIAPETKDSDGGAVDHDGEIDDYDVVFRLDENVALNGNPASGKHQQAWLLEIDGRHGPGPFEFFGPKPEKFIWPVAGNLDLPVFPTVPLPASALLLLGALAGLALFRRRKIRVVNAPRPSEYRR